MGYASMDFQLYAVIGGVTVDLVQFACSYEMNKIPTATAVVPVGKYVIPPHPILRTAHVLSNDEMLQVPIQVYVSLIFGSGDQTAIIPAGTYCIFCGWVTGVGYRRTYESYSAAIECTHWLSALNFSSSLLEGWHPNNPAHFEFPSLMMMPNAGGATDLGHFTPVTMVQEWFTEANITTDMWDNAIKPWFQELATNHIRLGGTPMGAADNDGVGGEAAAALGAFAGDDLPVKKYSADGDYLATAICRDIGVHVSTPSARSNSLAGMAHTTLWDKLVGDLSPKYMFKVIPYPTMAKVVPFIPGLRNYWDPYGLGFTILARDMEMQDMAAHLPRATRAVGILAGIGGRKHTDLTFDHSGTWDDTIGGVYKARDDGIVIIRDAPAWLGEYVPTHVYSVEALGIGGTRATAHNHPDAGAAPTTTDPEALHDDQVTLLNELAHAYYVEELLKNRFGDISGPVRFDIAPGSTIKFEGTDPASVQGEPRYGSVLRTSHFFDAQHQRCYTAFRLSHVRTHDEHLSDDYTLTEHPLYDRVWVGDYNLYLGSCP
jgi:hypothetical protein